MTTFVYQRGKLYWVPGILSSPQVKKSEYNKQNRLMRLFWKKQINKQIKRNKKKNKKEKKRQTDKQTNERTKTKKQNPQNK